MWRKIKSSFDWQCSRRQDNFEKFSTLLVDLSILIFVSYVSGTMWTPNATGWDPVVLNLLRKCYFLIVLLYTKSFRICILPPILWNMAFNGDHTAWKTPHQIVMYKYGSVESSSLSLSLVKILLWNTTLHFLPFQSQKLMSLWP